MWFFLWFPVRFQVFSISYRSSAIVSNKTVRDFDRSGPSQAIDICNAFDSFWHTGLLNKLTYYEILCQIFSLIFFLSVMSSFGGSWSWIWPTDKKWLRKQPPKVFYRNRCFQIFRKIHRETQGLWHRCFSISFVKFLRTPFLQNTTGRLLLSFDRLFNSVGTDVK